VKLPIERLSCSAGFCNYPTLWGCFSAFSSKGFGPLEKANRKNIKTFYVRKKGQ